MNPTAADYEQAIQELREGLYKKPIDPAELVVGPTLDWIANRARDIAAARQTDSVERDTKIDRDEGYERDYIPLPGGCEVQTKGRGSSFRVVTGIGTPNEQRLNIPDSPYLHETLERMARDIHAATFGVEK
jgi:hypothetical protein